MQSLSELGTVCPQFPSNVTRPNQIPTTPNIPQSLAALERASSQLYSPDAHDRSVAAFQLHGLVADPQKIELCHQILAQSNNDHALLMAATAYLKLITTFWNCFNENQISHMRNFCLSFIVNGQHRKGFILNKISQCLARVIKLSWHEKDNFLDDIRKAFQLEGPSSKAAIVLHLVSEIVNQMKTHFPGEPISIFTDKNTLFREHSLSHVFHLGLSFVEHAVQGKLNDHCTLEALKLCCQCLEFEHADYSTSEFAHTISANWTELLQSRDPGKSRTKVHKTFFQLLLISTSPNIQATTLETLSAYATVVKPTNHDSSASNIPVLQHITGLCTGMLEILQKRPGIFNNEDVHFQFSRLANAIKSTHRLAFLSQYPNFNTWLSVLSDFSLKSLKYDRSLYHLLHFWMLVANACSKLRAMLRQDDLTHMDAITVLNDFVIKFPPNFIARKLKILEEAHQQNDLKSICTTVEFEDEILYFAGLCVYSLAEASQVLLAAMDPLIARFENAIKVQETQQGRQEIQRLEVILSYFLRIIGPLMKENVHNRNRRDQQKRLSIRAALSKRVLILVTLMQKRVTKYTPNNERWLDMAMLDFLEYFSAAFIGFMIALGPSESNSTISLPLGVMGMAQDGPLRMLGGSGLVLKRRVSGIYELLSKQLGKEVSQSELTGQFVELLISYLTNFSEDTELLTKVLALFWKLVTWPKSRCVVVKLACIQALLEKHTTLQFLQLKENYELRTIFYRTLTHVLFSHISKFPNFMTAFEEVFRQLNNSGVSAEIAKELGIRVCWDLSGIISAITNASAYRTFFKWFYPNRYHILLRMLEIWHSTAEVGVPILHVMAELLNPSNNRITFDKSSPSGYLLFKDVSKLLRTYCNAALQNIANDGDDINDPYEERYKPLLLCMRLLQRSLRGNYLNFGVFEVYNDECMCVVFLVIRLAFKITLDIIFSYQEIHKEYMLLLIVLFQDHLRFLAREGSGEMVLMLVESLLFGLRSTDKDMLGMATQSLDAFGSACWKLKQQGEEESHLANGLQKAVSKHMYQMLTIVLDRVLYDAETDVDCRIGVLSSPILSLVVLFPEFWPKYQGSLKQSQPPRVHGKLEKAFMILDPVFKQPVSDLMSGSFRREFRNKFGNFRNEVRSFIVPRR